MGTSTDIGKAIIRAAVPRPVRNWLRSPSRSAQWIWDAAAFSLGATRTLSLPPGWPIVCHPHFYMVVRQAQVEDPEQAREFESFVRYCTPEMFLFDIGAHFGIFSLAAAHFGGRSIAVDPSPIATKMIATECMLNGASSHIQILRAAVSDACGTVAMLSSGVFSDGYFKFAKGRSKSDLTNARAFTLDQMAAQYGNPSHIKIDVEGHEAAVLRGARSTLAQSAPTLFLELHNQIAASEGIDPRSPLNELASFGYVAYAVDGRTLSSEEILSRSIVRIIATRRSS